MTNILNYTPHTINLNNGTEYPSVGVARVTTSYSEIPSNDNINFYQTLYGEIEGLPAPETNTLYIVSAIVLQAGKALGRTDLIAPATNHPETIRNEKGHIVSVPGFTI
jgi:hypothetical protein